MRAKTIHENEFVRGLNPKAAMKIGGLDLRSTIRQKRSELTDEIEKVENKANKKWQEYLKKLFIGKTITTKMRKLSTFNKDTMKQTSMGGSGEFTIKVKDVLMDKISDNSLIIADVNNNIYSIVVERDEKIYID
mgnify:FL=1